MEVENVKITVRRETYRFYQGAAAHVSGGTPEKLMADALEAYTDMVTGKSTQAPDIPSGNSSTSKSR